MVLLSINEKVKESLDAKLGAGAVKEILASDSRRLHSLLRDQRAIAGIGRAWANEILHHAQLSPYALSGDLVPEQVERLAVAGVADHALRVHQRAGHHA